MERKDVFDLVNGEREYQEKLWAGGTRSDGVEDKDKHVSEWLIYLEKYLDLAKNKVVDLENDGALIAVRKIAAIAVACMEHNETPAR